jgi:hypothetical protein
VALATCRFAPAKTTLGSLHLRPRNNARVIHEDAAISGYNFNSFAIAPGRPGDTIRALEKITHP